MLGTCVIPHFQGILTEKSICGIILVIEGHLQGHFHGILTEKSICGIILVIEGHLQGQKFNSKVKGIKNSVIYMFDVILTE